MKYRYKVHAEPNGNLRTVSFLEAAAMVANGYKVERLSWTAYLIPPSIYEQLIEEKLVLEKYVVDELPT